MSRRVNIDINNKVKSKEVTALFYQVEKYNLSVTVPFTQVL